MKKAQINIIVQVGIFAILAAFFTQLGEMPEEAKGYPTGCDKTYNNLYFSFRHLYIPY